jgi:hypothetical protein
MRSPRQTSMWNASTPSPAKISVSSSLASHGSAVVAASAATVAVNPTG